MVQRPVAIQIGHYPSLRAAKRGLEKLFPGWLVEIFEPELSLYPFESIRRWHQDVYLSKKTYDAIITWSNCESTEVKRKGRGNHKILRFEPGAVILIFNKRAWHRVPPKVSKHRWLVRAAGPAVTAFASHFR